VYATCFTKGHRTEAMQSLRVPTEMKKVGTATFRFGLFLGLSVAILGFCFYLVSVVDSDILLRMRPGLITYRMLAMAVLMTWYWGADMYVWTKYRVNYVFIFEFNLRSHVTYHHIFEVRKFPPPFFFLSDFQGLSLLYCRLHRYLLLCFR